MSELSENLLARISNDLISSIRNVLPASTAGFALHEPEFIGNELKYLNECIESSFVSSAGKFIDEFERKIATYTGSKYAVATINGTSALQLALQVSGVSTASEVLLPSLTFVATANAVHHLGAKPHFVDVDLNRMTMCPKFLEKYLDQIIEMRDGIPFNRNTNRAISAIIPMHIFGHPADITGLLEVARTFNIAIVEDAAEALGSFLNGKHCGTFGKAGALSFNGNKIITTGGGGAVLTNDPQLAKRAKHLSTTAKVADKWKFIHDEVGYNFRMPNLNAAIGLAQIEELDRKLIQKRKLAALYNTSFKKSEFARFIMQPLGCQSNYWLNTIVLKRSTPEFQDQLISSLHEEKIFVRPVWVPLHHLTPYKDYPRSSMKNTENLASRIINIPSSPQILQKIEDVK